jgi:intracellular protein transport protein USO1
VGVLDDSRDAVRTAGLVLLVDLTSGANEDLRKIVAFEDVFAKVFALINAEGGLGEAGVIAQDCLSLLNNLIKGSASNQTMFRESGCVKQMAQLLKQAFPPAEPEAQHIQQGRERAAWGLLQLLASFLEPGEKGTPSNQQAFFRAGTAQVLIDLGCSPDLPPPIRTLCLRDAALLVSLNAPLQESFAALTVESPSSGPDAAPQSPPQTNGTRSAPHSNKGSARPSAERPRTYIIEALLDLTLTAQQEDSALRTAACNLIQAYLAGHARIKEHFLGRAIDGHTRHEEAANVLITLLHPGAEAASVVYASWIVSDLIADIPEAKAALAAIKEGNEAEGEDVLTSIQALGSQLQQALQLTDERLVCAYAGLLTVLLWDFADGVNNLLAEGSGLIQALVAVVDPAVGKLTIGGLAATLLGTIYEFSTKDSPIPRRTLAPLLTQKLGRAKYLDGESAFIPRYASLLTDQ